MKIRLSWILSILGLLAIAALLSGYVYFRLERWDGLEEVIAQGRRRAAPQTSDVEALLHLLESPDVPIADRNRALWALGELADETALPLLVSLDNFEECDHSTRICVRELRKAISKIHSRAD